MGLTLDWEEYKAKSREVVAEGIVLLENKDNVLPFKVGEKVALFGRMQFDYYKSGTGSGGMVNVNHVVNIIEGLQNSGRVIINEKLAEIYKNWIEENPFDEGEGWGTEPWSQVEMPVSKDVAQMAAEDSDVAVVVIGRTAGEDKDSSDTEGAYRLSKDEMALLENVRSAFDRMVVLLNIGSIMDMSFVDEIKPEGVAIIWQGGMVGGDGTADVLTGKVCPSGRLTDTIAYSIDDYPAAKYFGDPNKNAYVEDIYVGYRYFETFAKDRVRYPFGYGLSYTSFDIVCDSCSYEERFGKLVMKVTVTNTGNVPGKQVVQVYGKAPTGCLGKPERVLIAFAKTKTLLSSESETLTFNISESKLASYDDLGNSGYPSSFVLEEGAYAIYVGADVRSSKAVYTFELSSTKVVEKLEKALWPVESFNRMKAQQDATGGLNLCFEEVPVSTIDEAARREKYMPDEIPQVNEDKYQLKDVLQGNASMDDFIAQLTDDDLACIVRGEGMGSALVTPGTASAFGGVNEHLRKLGMPAICCDDGPSGMRLDSGAKAFSLPSGTMIACTFNDKLTTELFEFTSLEMCNNRVECLLGPGMNIHRFPLNGRNFEYFSEDPLVTGAMAGACLRGLKKYGVTGTVKHFCANNQEYSRRAVDAIVSERALREIYLKGFEMVIRNGEASSVMTTYGSVNGLWTASSIDLTTTILRQQWGFKGVAMTDWWADMNVRGGEPCKNDFASMVIAQNDLYMVVANSSANEHGDNTIKELEAGNLKRAELQRCAKNICEFVMNSQTMQRYLGMEEEIKIINGESDGMDGEAEAPEYIPMDTEITIDLTYKESKAGTDYIIPLDISRFGDYEIVVTASSNLNAVSQSACTLYYTGVPFCTYTFNGSDGKDVSLSRELYCHNRFGLFRLNVPKNGLNLKSISFKLLREHCDKIEE